MNLIIPVAGLSSRFPTVRPKWMLTHPNGQLMVTAAIQGLPLEQMDRVFLVALKEHVEPYGDIAWLYRAFAQIGINDKLEVILLERRTRSQAETVAIAIERSGMCGSIYVKDTDNFFNHPVVETDNCVTTYSLEQMNAVHAKNKSYVTTNANGFLTNIAEKQVIGSQFCTGGYVFQDCRQYLGFFHQLQHADDLYLSHVIKQMVLNDITFKACSVADYTDWGTLTDWNHYRTSFMTLLIDIDGTLVFSSGQYLQPTWGTTKAIVENVAVINALYDSGKVQIILTTARSSQYRKQTIEQLNREGIKYHQVIFDLFHAQRIIINDYSPTNPYPSCRAINLLRDSEQLQNFLYEN